MYKTEIIVLGSICLIFASLFWSVNQKTATNEPEVSTHHNQAVQCEFVRTGMGDTLICISASGDIAVK